MSLFGTVGFIGGGNMAEALVRCFLKGTLPPGQIILSEPVEERRMLLNHRYQVNTTGDNLEVVRNSDLVILAIKPQMSPQVLKEIAPSFSSRKLLISILAGVATETLEGYFDGSPRVVRAMPNTAAIVGEAATAICPGRHASAEDLSMARDLFTTVGTVQVVTEGLMDAVTGLSGSGPAFVFTVIEALIDGGVRQGLSRETAHALAVQTVLGAARLVQKSAEHPAVLRDRVCSPGGTTIAGMQAIEERGLRATLIEAVARATQRSRELGGK